jgi:isopentenyl phosphate kinase
MAIGMAETKIALLTLQQFFIKKLVTAGIPAVSVSPSSLLRMYTPTEDFLDRIQDEEQHEKDVQNEKERQLTQLSIQIKKHIQNGLIPVLHGDVVLDDGQGVNVLSGDVIVEMLCQVFTNDSLYVPLVLFVTDVSGVYIHAPNEEEERTAKGLLREMQVVQHEEEVKSTKQHYTMVFHMYHDEEEKELRKGSTKLTPKFSLLHAHDVSGGLEEKMRNALAIVRNDPNVHVYIMKCGTKDARQIMVKGCVQYETTRGTHIYRVSK